METKPLEILIYQIADDSMLKENRSDGSGWDWCWADWQREWMDATPNRFAYRCLPLTIANQTGWWVKNPVGFEATWRGRSEPGTIDFRFDVSGSLWSEWINNQFGHGIITWNTPFLFRTRPEGSRLLICGPINMFKAYAHPLSAIIESDWMSMSFTMNWKLMVPNQPVRFDLGEPLFQAIPLVSNLCADLESSVVTYQRLSDDPEIFEAYHTWHQGRRQFHQLKANGEVKPDEWQKDYFQGRDALGRPAPTIHQTKLRPPRIHYTGSVRRGLNPESGGATTAIGGFGGVREENPVGQVYAEASSCPAGATEGISGVSVVGSGTTAVAEPMAAMATQVAEAGCPLEALQARSEGSVGEPSEAAVEERRVDDEWRRWIAENLMLEGSPESIVNAMVAAGIPRDEAAREVQCAVESPYVRGSQILRNRLRKRDWLLATYRKLHRMHPKTGEIERRHQLSREKFLRNYYIPNRPVIITGMMDDWPALTKWNLDYFAERFGDREVEVQMGREAGANYEIEREKYIHRLPFRRFIEMIRSTTTGTNDFYLTANNNSSNKKTLPELWEDIVQIPEYLDGSDPMGGFFWMGPPGTITPFHHDLTNNFMAQVIGRKRVKIAPSWDMPLMRNTLHCFSRVDGRTAPLAPYPAADEPQILECILGPGEILFLPIGCLHYVEGMDLSVTVSFTNFVFDNDFSSFYTTYNEV